MAAQASRTVPSSPNPSTQGSPRTRDWTNLRSGEPGAAFRGISRGKASRAGGLRGGRGRPSNNSGPKSGSHPDTTNCTPSPSPTAPSASPGLAAPTPNAPTSNGLPEKAVDGSADRGSRHKPGSRNKSRTSPTVVVAPTSPSQTSHTAPPTPSRSAQRRRRHSGKPPATPAKPLPLPKIVNTQNSRVGSILSSQSVLRKDVPPHFAAAHEAEIRHDIDVLVERVRAVAMAENRPTTPGSHIDWAGNEDDSLPDLDDWGVTTHTNAAPAGNHGEQISPILADALRPLPEPNSEPIQEEEREMESYDAESIHPQTFDSSSASSPVEKTLPTIETRPEQYITEPTTKEALSSPTRSDGKCPLHPSLPPKPVAAMEVLRSRGGSIGKPSSLPTKPLVLVAEELATRTEGLSDSILAPSSDERLALERVSSTSSSERGLTASIHAPIPGLPESHSAPSLLSTHTPSAGSRAHSRSQTDGQKPRPTLVGTASHRRGRSGATSPLGKHVYSHSRNHSTPAAGAGIRLPQAARPVITGEAISRLARTIGGLGPTPRTQTIHVTNDSTISS